MLREKIKFNGQTQSIKISLSKENQLLGLQEDIDGFISNQNDESINEVVDGEKLRYLPQFSVDYDFLFNIGSGNFAGSLLAAGFTNADIDNRTDAVLKSFYIAQVYDSKDIDNQTLLHTSYYNGFLWVIDNEENTTYDNLDSSIEFTNYYLPNNIFDDDSVKTLFVRFYFYNAKTGRLQLFFNNGNASSTTEDRLFFEIEVDPLTKKYNFNGVTELDIREINNTDYINKINNTLDSFEIQSPVTPAGKLFKNDGTYDNIDL